MSWSYISLNRFSRPCVRYTVLLTWFLASHKFGVVSSSHALAINRFSYYTLQALRCWLKSNAKRKSQEMPTEQYTDQTHLKPICTLYSTKVHRKLCDKQVNRRINNINKRARRERERDMTVAMEIAVVRCKIIFSFFVISFGFGGCGTGFPSGFLFGLDWNLSKM